MKVGRITDKVRQRSILQQIKTKRDEVIIGAGPGEDCAIFSFSGQTGKENDANVVISCTKEGFPDRGIRLLLQECINTLAARGGEPVAAAVRFLLPEDTEEERVRRLMTEAEAFCAPLGIQIAEASGRVSEAVTKPYAVVSAYALAGAGPAESSVKRDFHTAESAEEEHDIVVSKWIGLAGTAMLAEQFRENLLERYPAWLVDEAQGFDRYLLAVREAAVAIEHGAAAICPVYEGGIFTALWELAEGAGIGFSVDWKKLPLRQETVEICNHCNRNPYELLSGGCFLMTARDGQKLADALTEEGIPAAVVGKMTAGRDKLLINGDEIRYLDRPHTDEIYKTIGIDTITGGER